MLNELNIQLFADEEDPDILEDVEDLEEDPEGQEETEEPETEEDTEEQEDEEKEPLDKKTKAIIHQKRENAELRKQLAELQERLQSEELAKEETNRIAELTKGGKKPEEATEIAKNETEVKKLRLQLARYEITSLEQKYPGISAFARQLADDKAKLPEFSYEQLYLAKYSKSSAYDEKTRLEQEILYKSKEAKDKSLDSSNPSNKRTTKLSAEDEKAYQILRKVNPKLTRKEFSKAAESKYLD